MREACARLTLSLALVLGAPGLPAYQAAAQLTRAPAGVPVGTPGAWTSVLGELASGLETAPAGTVPAGLIRTLGHLRLELSLSPKSVGALALVRHFPAHALEPAAFAKLPLNERASLAAAAARRVTEELAPVAAEVLAKARAGRPLSRDDASSLAELGGAWFYLPADDALLVRELTRHDLGAGVLGVGSKIAAALGRPYEEKPARVLTREAAFALRGAARLTLQRPDPAGGVSERWVRDVLAPAVARSLDGAAERVAERGHGADALWKGLLLSHLPVFGRVAPRELRETLRDSGVWTDFVAAVTAHAAERLAASPEPSALEALRVSGWRTEFQFRFSAWDARAQTHRSVGEWLAAEHGAPTHDPAEAFGARAGSLAGIPIRVEPQAANLAAVMTLALTLAMRAVDPSAGLFMNLVQALAGAALVYASTIAHELGHALAARAFGEPVIALALTGKGGGAVIYSNVRRPVADFFLTAAGPAVTLLWTLASALAAFAFLGTRIAPVFEVQAILGLLGFVMNVLPILPSDGGRMLRAAIVWRSGDHYRATKLAAAAGAGIALALGAGAAWLVFGLLGWLPAGAIAAIALWLAHSSWEGRVHAGTILPGDRPGPKG
ncbi:MAG: M50 family metallopeptidase [Elusimicrobia bacterium]|nr:M50 family metallopeptidase [Elusimicrobiota bacterium]